MQGNTPTLLLICNRENLDLFYGINIDKTTLNRIHIPISLLPEQADSRLIKEMIGIEPFFSKRLQNLYSHIHFFPIHNSDGKILFYFINLNNHPQNCFVDHIDEKIIKSLLETLDINNETKENLEISEFDSILSENLSKGSCYLYKLVFRFSNSSNNEIFINSSYQSDLLLAALNNLIGSRTKVLRKSLSEYFFIIPEDFSMDPDLLKHQLEIALLKIIKGTINWKISSVESIKVNSLDEKVMTFIEGDSNDLGEI